jgi:hypothetical protein
MRYQKQDWDGVPIGEQGGFLLGESAFTVHDYQCGLLPSGKLWGNSLSEGVLHHLEPPLFQVNFQALAKDVAPHE